MGEISKTPDEKMRQEWAAERLALAGVTSETHEVRFDGAVVTKRPILSPDAPLTDLADLMVQHQALLARIVRRAKYDALREMSRALDGWMRGAKDNHDAMDHRDCDPNCWTTFHAVDVRSMIADAASAAGTTWPAAGLDA